MNTLLEVPKSALDRATDVPGVFQGCTPHGLKQKQQSTSYHGRSGPASDRSEGYTLTTIVSLALDPESSAWFEAQRQRYYPTALNRIPAHLSLFHSLPGEGSIRHALEGAARNTSTFPLRVTAVRSMGRGVMYTLESPELIRLHEALVAEFRTYLTPQDKQPLRPHVVVQNKVEPSEAKTLLADLLRDFSPRRAQAVGLDWWEYLGGPWRLLERLPFNSCEAKL